MQHQDLLPRMRHPWSLLGRMQAAQPPRLESFWLLLRPLPRQRPTILRTTAATHPSSLPTATPATHSRAPSHSILSEQCPSSCRALPDAAQAEPSSSPTQQHSSCSFQQCFRSNQSNTVRTFQHFSCLSGSGVTIPSVHAGAQDRSSLRLPEQPLMSAIVGHRLQRRAHHSSHGHHPHQ